MALFTMTTTAYTNLPPSQVGDGTASTNYATIHTFTTADFTTNTSPPYADPEGDPAANLKITSLPAIGTIKYDNVAISINQIVSFADIALNKLTYTPNNGTTSLYNDTFNFEISDAGSGTFVG